MDVWPVQEYKLKHQNEFKQNGQKYVDVQLKSLPLLRGV